MLIDSHCHLDFDDFENDIDEIIKNAKDSGITAMLNAGNTIDDLENQLKISEKYPFVFSATGVHPHNASDYLDMTIEDLTSRVDNKNIIAIGEAGLDYYYDNSPRDVQIKVFKTQIKAAQETGLPIIVHTRDADDDTIKILGDAYKEKPFTGVIHCFSTSKRLADFALSIGFYISVSGMITFNKAQELRDIIKDIPIEKLLIETDSPFLAPVPMRGKRNQPAYIIHTAEKLAEIKNMAFDKLAYITSDNFYDLFTKASNKNRGK
jgi:TatD DNase family protein